MEVVMVSAVQRFLKTVPADAAAILIVFCAFPALADDQTPSSRVVHPKGVGQIPIACRSAAPEAAAKLRLQAH
jgi:hypothetical protein